MSKQLTWLDFVGHMFGCYADENGNMPCDNGMVCDRCGEEWVDDAFKEAVAESLFEANKFSDYTVDIPDKNLNTIRILIDMLQLVLQDVKVNIGEEGGCTDTLTVIQWALKDYSPKNLLGEEEMREFYKHAIDSMCSERKY
jgi:hypothetical protein